MHLGGGRLLAGLVAGLILLAGCGAESSGSEEQDHGQGDEAPVAVQTQEGDSPYRGLVPTEPFSRPSFVLRDQAGQPYDFTATTGGELTLLFFGYTNCPDICPTTMANVAVALRNVDPGLAESVRVVFVTTDPVRDDSAALGEYLDRFDPDLPTQFVGLTGTLAEVAAAQEAAGVPLAEDHGQQHSTLLLLYGRDDLARVAFLAGSTPDDISHDLQVVADE